MNETKSTPPVKIGGTEFTRFNALRHGVLSRYAVLPWEDAAEYRDLVAALVAEHDVNEIVRIVRMPCRFGGARPYFVCPGVANGTACGRRVT